jgi:uncharacterized protein
VVTARRPARGGAVGAGRGRAHEAVPAPIDDREIDELQALLESVPAPFEPLDVSSLDGFLCGVIVQPGAVPWARWLPFVTDIDGRALPAAFDARRLHALALRRDGELRRAIGRRTWFDPWVFELDDDDDDDGAGDEPRETDDDDDEAAVDAVYPWVAGFVAALETFPGLLAGDEAVLNAPLALIYRHLGADDVEDADALLAEIESLEPPADLAGAVGELVRATLLLADVAGVPRER